MTRVATTQTRAGSLTGRTKIESSRAEIAWSCAAKTPIRAETGVTRASKALARAENATPRAAYALTQAGARRKRAGLNSNI